MDTEIEYQEDQQKPLTTKYFKWVFALIILIVTCTSITYVWLNSLNQPPTYFPSNLPITIEAGADIESITQTLEKAGVVKSGTLLYYVLVFAYDPTTIKASTYVFDKPITTLNVARHLIEGDFDSNLISFTHFEGERVSQLAYRADKVLTDFDPDVFIEIAEPHEGTLFPDTYFINPDFTEEELSELMRSTFEDKTREFEVLIDSHSLTLSEILILASIIEREANTLESKKYVSGILQNRLDIGMALQADASIEYVLDKPLSELTPADLEIESPYNTYLNTGLPPTPIGNPGLESIIAVLEPTASEYIFYITGNDGNFYYAETYDQHLRNINVHLR